MAQNTVISLHGINLNNMFYYPLFNRVMQLYFVCFLNVKSLDDLLT